MEKSDGSPPKRPSSPRKQAAMQRPNYTHNFPHNLQFAEAIYNNMLCWFFLPYFLKNGYFFHRNLLQISSKFFNNSHLNSSYELEAEKGSL